MSRYTSRKAMALVTVQMQPNKLWFAARVFVPLDQRSKIERLWKQPFKACAMDACADCAGERLAELGYFLCYFNMVAPSLAFGG